MSVGQTSYTTPEMEQILEAMIDSERLHYVLEVLGRICSEKSDHIMASYGDKPLADKWAEAGSNLSLLSGKYYNQLG